MTFHKTPRGSQRQPQKDLDAWFKRHNNNRGRPGRACRGPHYKTGNCQLQSECLNV